MKNKLITISTNAALLCGSNKTKNERVNKTERVMNIFFSNFFTQTIVNKLVPQIIDDIAE